MKKYFFQLSNLKCEETIHKMVFKKCTSNLKTTYEYLDKSYPATVIDLKMHGFCRCITIRLWCLHIFKDDSERNYDVQFICIESRVAPLKSLSLHLKLVRDLTT